MPFGTSDAASPWTGGAAGALLPPPNEEEMMSDIWFKAGEATVLAADGQATDAMPEVLIGSVRGPVGQAFASMMGQVQGHTRMFVVRDLNQMVRPATMMTTKATIHTEEYVDVLGGVV